ncbi:DUF5989 family protein [Methylogaea oryzae]|uniref:DUF5989 family protein n=1 Tax=Methylogaea oryzae TaxID=1295382 RepID=UPI0020D07827|nr:DUF5989 family protein [Methylogaea oryzae]
MLDLLKDLWGFLKVRKKFWLAPIILVLLLLGALIVFSQVRWSHRSFTPCSDRVRLGSTAARPFPGLGSGFCFYKVAQAVAGCPTMPSTRAW